MRYLKMVISTGTAKAQRSSPCMASEKGLQVVASASSLRYKLCMAGKNPPPPALYKSTRVTLACPLGASHACRFQSTKTTTSPSSVPAFLAQRA